MAENDSLQEMESRPKRLSPEQVEQAVDELRRELTSLSGSPDQRVEMSSDNIEQGLAKLVLSLIELLRRLMERQAIRRMEGGSLTDEQVEEVGSALMKLEVKVTELAAAFGLTPEDLNLDLGPLGKLLEK